MHIRTCDGMFVERGRRSHKRLRGPVGDFANLSKVPDGLFDADGGADGDGPGDGAVGDGHGDGEGHVDGEPSVLDIWTGEPFRLLPQGAFFNDVIDWTSTNAAVQADVRNKGGYFASQPSFQGNWTEHNFGMLVASYGISSSAANAVRDFVKDPRFRPWALTMDSKQRQKRILATVRPQDRLQKYPMYSALGLHEYCDKAKQVFLFVKAMYAAAQQLASRFRRQDYDLVLNQKHHVDAHGKTRYSRHIGSTNRIARLSKWVHRRHGPSAITFPIIVGSDKASFPCSLCLHVHLTLHRSWQTNPNGFSSGPTEIFPMYMGHLSLHPDLRQLAAARVVIALLPVTKNADDTEERRVQNGEAHQWAQNIVLSSMREGMTNGWLLKFKGDKDPFTCVPGPRPLHA